MMLPVNLRVFLAVGTTDMRKSIDGLCLLVQMQLVLDPFAGHLFGFCNRRRIWSRSSTGTATGFVSGRSGWSGTEPYHLLFAEGGPEALSAVAESKVDAALVDLVMPGMGGLAVLREFRQKYPEMMIGS